MYIVYLYNGIWLKLVVIQINVTEVKYNDIVVMLRYKNTVQEALLFFCIYRSYNAVEHSML